MFGFGLVCRLRFVDCDELVVCLFIDCGCLLLFLLCFVIVLVYVRLCCSDFIRGFLAVGYVVTCCLVALVVVFV